MDNEALLLWTEATKRAAGNPTGANQYVSDQVGNVDIINDSSPDRPTGTSAAAGLRRLQKEAASEALRAAIASVRLSIRPRPKAYDPKIS